MPAEVQMDTETISSRISFPISSESWGDDGESHIKRYASDDMIHSSRNNDHWFDGPSRRVPTLMHTSGASSARWYVLPGSRTWWQSTHDFDSNSIDIAVSSEADVDAHQSDELAAVATAQETTANYMQVIKQQSAMCRSLK